MSELIASINKKRFLLLPAALFVLLLRLAFTGLLPESSLWLCLRFAGLFLCFLAGGYAFARLLRPSSSTEVYAFSFSAGYLIFLAAFVIWALTGRHAAINYTIVLLPCAAGLFFLYKDGKQKGWTAFRPSASCMVLWAILALLTLAGVGLYNILPESGGYFQGFTDVVWNIGNTNSLIRTFPDTQDIHLSGVSFHYHYLSFMFKGELSLLLGCEPELVFFLFSSIISTGFLCFALTALSARYLHGSAALAIAPTVLTVFTATASSLTTRLSSSFTFFDGTLAHIFYYPNGVDYAMPLLCVSLLLALRYLDTRAPGQLLFLMLMVVATTGSKGPAGALLFGVGVGMLALSLINQRHIQAYLLLFTAITFPFVITYFFLLAGDSTSSITLSPLMTVKTCSFGRDLLLPLLDKVISLLPFAKGLLTFIFLLGGMLLYYVCFLPAASIPALLQCKNDILAFFTADLTDEKLEHFLLSGTAFGAILIAFLFATDGSSQLYFLILATPMFHILAVLWLRQHWKSLRKAARVLYIFAFAVAFCSAWQTHLSWGKSGISFAKEQLNTGACTEIRYGMLSSDEYQALVWIRENTPADAVLATDRHYFVRRSEVEDEPHPNDISRYYFYSAFTGRQVFLESWSYAARTDDMKKYIQDQLAINDSFYAQDTTNRVELLNTYGIHYVIVSAYENPGLTLPELEQVYNGTTIQVYRVPD